MEENAKLREIEETTEKDTPETDEGSLKHIDEGKESSQVLMKGASILVVAAVISKVFGAIFRIPLTNMIGMEGMSYYSTAYPLYQLMFSIATAGFPVAISRMVSERIAKGDHINAHKAYKLALRVSVVLGAVSFAIVFFGAGMLSRFYKNPDAELSMRSVAFALLFTPIIASMRGYYQGRQEMRPTAVTEVFEQMARVVVGLTLAYAFYKTSLVKAAAGATFGASAGVVVALIIMFFIYRKDSTKRKELEAQSLIREENDNQRLKELFWFVIPITLSSCIMPIMFNIDTFIIMRRLIATGWSQPQARDLYGLMAGYCDPIVSLPSVIIDAICISMMPAITRAFTLKNNSDLNSNLKTGLKTMLVVSFPCMVGLMVLGRPILETLYYKKIDEAHMAVPTLQILAMTIVTFAIMRAFSTSLQGIGKMMLPVANLFIGAAIKVIISYVLVGIPAINVNGAAAGSVMTYVVAGYLNYRALKKYADVSLDMKSIFLKPFIASAIMGAATIAVYKLCYLILSSAVSPGFISTAFSMLVAVAAAVVVYFVTSLKIGAVTKEEIELIPKGDVLYRFARKMKIAE